MATPTAMAPGAHSYASTQYFNGHAVTPVPPPRLPHVPAPHTLAPPIHSPPVLAGPSTPGAGAYPFSNATLAPFPGPQTPSIMGPPSKPAERAVKEYRYDVDDSLAGTGINLDQEEQILADYYAGKYRPEAVTGFPANPPGSKASFYGAGFANQPGQPALDDESRAKSDLAAAKQAWTDSARALAVARSNELNDPFVQTPSLHFRAAKIAKEYGIELNDETREDGQNKSSGQRLANPTTKPVIIVETARTPDGAMVTTCGSLIPKEAYLADQIALLSIAVKHRVRELLEETNRVAAMRQMTGVPEDWLEAAAPLVEEPVPPQAGDGSAVGPGTNPLKRTWPASRSRGVCTLPVPTDIAHSRPPRCYELGSCGRGGS